MRKHLRHYLALLLVPASMVPQTPASLAAIPPGNSVFQNVIPEATEACTDAEAKWWEELRAAGSEFAGANRRRDRAVFEARSQAHQRGRVLADDEDGLSRKERDRLNADLDAARQNYFRLLRHGTENSYRAPIHDTGRVVVLYTGTPNYTETARRNKTMGRVKLQTEFRADGSVGAVEVRQKLGDGLDQQAIEAIRRVVFLPATRDRLFVTISKSVEVDFNLK